MKRTKITRVAVDRLRLNEGQLPWLPKNPRSWTQTDIDRMVKSIDEDPDFAEVRPVLAVPGEGKELIVFAHNLLTKAAMVRGDKTLPVAVFEPETEEDQETIRRLALKDNGSFGSWDTDILANEWNAEPWQLEDCGVPEWITGGAGKETGSGAGTSGAEGSTKSAKEDEDFDPNAGILVRCKPGDVWQLGDHRLMCGDSTDLETVKTLMGGGLADISFFSPPYNTALGKNITKDNSKSKYLHDDDNMKREQYTALLDAAIRNAGACSRFTFCNLQVLANNKGSILDMLNNNRDRFADVIVWDKGRSQPQLAANVLNSEYEFVFVFSEAATRAIGTIPFHGTLKNIVHIMPGHNDFAEIHNAVYPVEFCGHFIEHFAKDTVLDLFGGTGTTMIAAEQLGRRCYMMEIDPHYCDIILSRWEQLTGRKATRLN